MNTFTTFRCAAFTGHPVKLHVMAVDAHGNVRVYDDVADHLTSCHALTARQEAAIRAKARSGPKAAGSGNFHSRP